MRVHTHQLLVTDDSLAVVGDPLDRWQQIEATLEFNSVGTGTATLVATGQARDQLQPGRRIMLLRDGAVFSAGPIEEPLLEWAVEGSHADPGLLSVTWADDLAPVAGRLTYPNPALAAGAQDTARREFDTTNAEMIMRALVDENAGPGALTARQVPSLTLGTVANVGTDLTWSTRFQPLADALREVAVAGGGLGFQVRQDGTDLLFEVYEPQDRSGTIRFSPAWGNLRQFTFHRRAPEMTTAIVGGRSAGADRTIVERTNSTAEATWGRSEQFVDRRDQEQDELATVGDEQLARRGEVSSLSTVAVDTEQQQFARDYQLGDVVAVALGNGAQVSNVVRGVQLSATPRDGEQVVAMVGTESAARDPRWIRQARQLSRELAQAATSGEIEQTS